MYISTAIRNAAVFNTKGSGFEIVKSQTIPSWKGPTRTTEPNPRPHAAPPAPVCESGVPALPELRHRGRAHCPGQPVPCPPPSGAQPFPQPHPPSPDTAPCRSLGPRRCHRQQSSALPSAPCESRGRHRASPQLLCSALSPPRALSAPQAEPSPSLQPSSGRSRVVSCLSYTVAPRAHAALEPKPHGAERARPSPLPPAAQCVQPPVRADPGAAARPGSSVLRQRGGGGSAAAEKRCGERRARRGLTLPCCDRAT